MKRLSLLLLAAPLTLATALLDDNEGRLSNKRADCPPDIIPISEVYGLTEGTDAFVQGHVTVPSGVFFGATNDPGFAMHDGTRGVYIQTATDLGLEFGDTVRVAGVTGRLNGMETIAADSVEDIEEFEVQLPTGHVAISTEGSVVVVTGVITRIVDDGQFGAKVFVDDGTGEVDVFLSSSTELHQDMPDFIEVGRRIRARGYVAFFPAFSQHTEIDPRTHDDLREIDDDEDDDDDDN